MVILPAIIYGLIVALIEIHFVHEDESVGKLWLKHAWHAAPFAIVGVFINMNLPWALGLIGLANTTIYHLALQLLVSLIIMGKISAAAAISSKAGFKEKGVHILIIGVLIFISPYVWNYLKPYVQSYLPLP